MRSNRETEIERALHEVRLAGLLFFFFFFLLQINGRNEQGRDGWRQGERSEEAIRGQINQLSSSDKLKIKKTIGSL